MIELNIYEQVELKEPIREVALSPSLARLTLQIVKESSTIERYEQGGFFGGVVRKGTLILWDNRQTAIGHEGNCVLYDKKGRIDSFRQIDNDMHQRTLVAIPDFKTIRYHSHPPINENILRTKLDQQTASNLIEAIRKELEAGIYSHLGITSLDEALNEIFSRQLSTDDSEQTVGKYHLLISPTVNPRKPFSHINVYDLRAGEERLIPVRRAKKEELAPFTKIEKRIQKEWKIANFGTEFLWMLTREQVQEAYIKIYHPLYDESLPNCNGGITVLY